MPTRTRDPIDESLQDVPPLLTADEAANLLRSSRRQLNRWIAAGHLKAIKCGPQRGNKLLIPKTSIAEFLARHYA